MVAPENACFEWIGTSWSERGVRVVLGTTSVGDSQAGGMQDSAVKVFKNEVRNTLVSGIGISELILISIDGSVASEIRLTLSRQCR